MARGPKIGPFVSLAIGTSTSESGRIMGSDFNASPGADHTWLMLGARGTYDL
jgi:hypothetical protein